MIYLQTQINLNFEALSYLNRRIFQEAISAHDSRYDVITKKLELAYQNLEPSYLVVEEKYAELLKLLSFRRDNSWVGFVFFKTIYLDESSHQETFAKNFSEWFDSILIEQFSEEKPLQENDFFNLLNEADITKEEKWNTFLLYQNYDYYAELFQNMIQEISSAISQEIKPFQPEIDLFISDWQAILLKEDYLDFIYQKYHLRLDSSFFESYQITPCVFGVNAIVWTNNLLFLGLIFTLDFEFQESISKENLSKYLKFLGDVSKFSIITQLLEKPMYGKELSESLNLTPATISYHMSDLAQEGLVRFVSGANKRIYYHLNIELLHEIKEALNIHLFSNIK